MRVTRRRAVTVAAVLAVGAIAAACVPVTPPPPTTQPNPTPTTKPPTFAPQPNLTFSPVPTRTPAPTVTKEEVLTGLQRTWGIAFTPSGDRMFLTEREGRISTVVPQPGIPWPAPTVLADFADIPGLITGSEGGLLGIAVDPAFATNGFLYTCYTAAPSEVQLVRFTVDDPSAPTDLVSAEVIVEDVPRSTGRHSGCRMEFDPTPALAADPPLYFVTGDAAIGTTPQSPTSLGGKVLRIDRDGAPYPGNNPPAGFDARIFSWGHRNIQGLAIQPNGSGMTAEHGTGCDDEVNLLGRGDFGWNPVPGYNETVPMTRAGAIPAVWTTGCPTIAPSGITFINNVAGTDWKGWNGAIAMAVLKDMHLRILFPAANGSIDIANDVEAPELSGSRLRSVVQSPADGNLYVTTDSDSGQIWRVVPS